MKKILHAFFIVLLLAFKTQLFANTVIVKGTVKDSLNNPVANKAVKIYNADSSNGCAIMHTVTTNQNGYYIDTLTCGGNIGKLDIVVENCNGARIIHDPNVGLSDTVESNFIICTNTVPPTPAPTCDAVFSFTSAATGIKFTAGASTAPPGDSITSYIWNFGDSTPAANGTKDPLHAYTKAGTYNVCVTIKTKKGCESTYCHTVVFASEASCAATAVIGFERTGTKKFRFTSAQSTTLPGDSISERIWQFSDGGSLDGDRLTVEKEFTDTGMATVCLKVVSSKGCDNRTCITIAVRDTAAPPPAACKASFVYTIQQNGPVKFNSTSSGTTNIDSVTGYTWMFGDSTAPVQGSRDPSHTFAKSGKYTVTLYIKTKSGCESKYSDTISITTLPPVNCSVDVQFTAERVSLRKVQFNSSNSRTVAGDSIIQRNWKFGDNTILGGNETRPVKEFPAPAIYNTCLEVKTAKGCVAQTCGSVTVEDTVTTPQSSVDYIKIITINPNPVVTRMMVTVFSRNSNAEAEIIIYDIYGSPRMTIKKLLAQGNNAIEINTTNLYHGPYFLKVGTKSGKDSKAFYKL